MTFSIWALELIVGFLGRESDLTKLLEVHPWGMHYLLHLPRHTWEIHLNSGA